MANLTANKEVIEQDGKIVSQPIFQGTIFKGALVKVNAAGFIAPCGAEAGSEFAGIAYESKTAATAGEKEVRVIKEGAFVLNGAGFVAADVNSKVYASDDQTVTKTSAANLQVVGYIEKVLSATEVLVTIRPYSGLGV